MYTSSYGYIKSQTSTKETVRFEAHGKLISLVYVGLRRLSQKSPH